MMADYDEEDDCLMAPAFYVGNCSNVDTSKPPSSGVEYLRHVHLESKKYPAVVIAPLDTKTLNSKQTVTYSNDNGFTPAPPGLAPNAKLQKDQVCSFSLLRMELSLKKKKIVGQLPPVVFPDISDRVAWCEYCLGSEMKKKLEHGTNKDNGNNRQIEDEEAEGHDPLLSVMLHLSHSSIEKLLAYHLRWLQAIGFSEKQGRWIFSLLALLEKPLRPETCDLLRHLARACATLRINIESDMDENLFGLNHIITLISRYFEQMDMSDDYVDKCVGELLGKTLVVNEDVEVSDEDEELDFSGSEGDAEFENDNLG